MCQASFFIDFCFIEKKHGADYNQAIMTANELRDKFINFFVSKGHKQISGASLIPENDPTVLFTTAGMQPLVPYILGQEHPAGKRLTDYQKCIRTVDIDSVGDPHHLTCFEMLGNWSLGDYFKKEMIPWSYEFLTKELGIKPEKLSVTVFSGDNEVPRDNESAKIWESLGIPKDHIFFLPREDNWWGPAGETGPCGPDSEMFIDTGRPKCGSDCKPGCKCGKYFEVWNDVFMSYNKTKSGIYEEMNRKCIDTGMGIERTIAILQGKKSVYETEIMIPLLKRIETLCGYEYGKDEQTDISMRIIADHARSSCFILGDQNGCTPSNIGQGYILRRLIRRAVRHGKKLGIQIPFLVKVAEVVINMYKLPYPELKENEEKVYRELTLEEEKFSKTLEKGEKQFQKICYFLNQKGINKISGDTAFKLYDTYGFPIELTEELAHEKNMTVDKKGYEERFIQHQNLSRTAEAGQNKSGLADHSEETTALHTATHLLHAALRKVLGSHVQQKGSNITAERLRFDFSHPEKMTNDQIKQVEDLVNDIIDKKLDVTVKTMSLDEAKDSGALAFFSSKYGEEVTVYSVGNFSKEVCAGPHVKNTGELGHFKIVKEESSSAGVRRIKAVLER